MAEGTRLRSIDERVGVQELKFNEFSENFSKYKEAMSTDLGEFKGRFTQIDEKFEELKQLILGTQSPNKGKGTERVSSKESSLDQENEVITHNREEVTNFTSSGNFQNKNSTMSMNHISHNNNYIHPSITYTNPLFNTTTIPPYNVIPPFNLPFTSLQPNNWPYYSTTTTPATVPYTSNNTVPPFTSNHPQLAIPSYNPYTHIHPSHNPVMSPQSPSHTGHANFNPCPKIEFPKFDGHDPKGWVLRAEQYFEFINIEEHKKVKLAGLHFEGKANVWYRYYQTSRGNINWRLFIMDVINRFENPDNRDVQDLFNMLKQVGTVTDYEDKFEELRAMIVTQNKNFSEEYFVSSFISGLKDHIKGAVKMFRPQLLSDAVFLAKQEESKFQKFTPNSNRHITIKPNHNTSSDYKAQSLPYSTPVGYKTVGKEHIRNRPTLSSREIIERRERGQCFHCDEPYHPGKECKSKLYLIIGEEDMVEEGEEWVVQDTTLESSNTKQDDLGEISFNAIAGNKSLNTIRLRGTVKNRKINILIDSGSTHSFIDASLVEQLHLPAEVVSPLMVTVADGSRMVLDTMCRSFAYEIQGQKFTTDMSYTVASAASSMASLSLSSTVSFPIPHLFAAQVSYAHPNTTTQLVTLFSTSSDSHPTGLPHPPLPPPPGPVINLISSSSESNSPSGSPVVISSSSSSDGQQPSPPPNRLQSPLSSEPVLPPPPAQQSSEPVLPLPPTCGACRALSKRKCNMSCEYRAFYPPEEMSSFAYLMEYFSPECVLRFLKAGPVEEVAARKRNLRKTAQMLNDDPANSASDKIDMLQQKLAAANETIQRLAVAAVASRND